MNIDAVTGWLDDARQVPSPNFNERPSAIAIDMVVVHSIELPCEFWGSGAIDALFCNRLDPVEYPFFSNEVDLRVSAHFLIARTGAITQYVPVHQRAWHAGVSSFQGKTGCNDFSIGIELEAGKDVPYTETQYKILARIIQALRLSYPTITLDRIVGHADIAPLRKLDPGPLFDWTRLMTLLR